MTPTHQTKVAANLIQIVWSGPFPFDSRDKFYDGRIDFGIYQIYGTYQDATGLLYIGRAKNGSFGWRLESHAREKLIEHNITDATFRVGRLAGAITPPNVEWDREIELAEGLLIYAQKPVLNVRVNLGELEPSVERMHICNWGERGVLLPEVSGLRWTQWGENLQKNIYDVEHNATA